MRKLLSSFSLVLIVVLCASVSTPSYAFFGNKDNEESSTDRTGQSFADLAKKLVPSVVNISSTQKYEEPDGLPEMPHFPPGSPFEDFFEEFMDRQLEPSPSVPPSSLGSGFVIDAQKGYIITNNHVIEGAEKVRVTFHDDSTVDAKVIGRDEKIDLAVLQVEDTTNLVAVDFGDSDVMRVGDWILAIGNPFGLGGTVTAGIVSAQQRDINAGPYDDFIQTDASINRGNSGGPMFNMEGEVIGINTAIFSPSGGSVGIGFALPSNLVQPVVHQLIEFGHTRRGWLGVRIQSVTDEIAESLGLEKTQGALVASITPDSPAEAAGLRAGDIILEFNGKKITEMRTLPRAVAETPIDKKVEVVFWRESKREKTSVTIGELEKAEEEGLISDEDIVPEEDAPEGLIIDEVGMALNTLTDDSRNLYSIGEDISGVLIESVDKDSEAILKGLRPGDVIIEINQQEVETPQGAQDIIAKAQKSKRSSVLLLTNRDGDVHFVALRLKKKTDKND